LDTLSTGACGTSREQLDLWILHLEKNNCMAVISLP
jgi:hypothetical protein